ncbi:MAG: hypothetical protein ACK4N5_04910, partial [Myxococcales bacterium]
PGTKHVGEVSASINGRCVTVKVAPGATAAQIGKDLAKALRAEFKGATVSVKLGAGKAGASRAEVILTNGKAAR